MTLKDQFKKKIEFKVTDTDRYALYARLQPLLDAAGEVLQGLDRWQAAWTSQDTSDSGPARRQMLEALERVRKLVE